MIDNLSIGGIDIGVPVILAPMSGVTDLPMRKAVKRLGGGLVVSEMLASNEALRHSDGTYKRLMADASENPHMVQIAGWSPELMAETARFCVDHGADIIDINFGCPARKITSQACGSALMKDIPRAREILEAVKKAVDCPVTAKMRLGWDHDQLNAVELALIAQDIGYAMITVHGRTRMQKYEGHADWTAISAVSQALSIPVIANGDINTFDDINECLKQSGADGVMVGRAAQGQPWIIGHMIHYMKTSERLETPDINKRKAILIQHYHEIIEHHGLNMGLRMARKHLGWSAKGFRDAARFRKEVMKHKCPDLVLRDIEKYFIEDVSDLNEAA
jgi:tRNA-dihydrouridine synthase B